MAALVRPLLALASAPWHVLAVRFSDRVGKGIRSAPRDALLADSAPSTRKGTAFGLHRAADHAGSVLGPLLGAGLLLLAPGNLRLVFALTVLPGLLTLPLLWKGVREVKPPPVVGARAEGSSPLDSPRVGKGTPGSLRDLGPAFPRYLAVLLLFTLGKLGLAEADSVSLGQGKAELVFIEIMSGDNVPAHQHSVAVLDDGVEAERLIRFEHLARAIAGK